MPDKCREQLFNVPGLAHRMANLMDLNVSPSTPPDSGNSLEGLSTQNGTSEGNEDEESESEEETEEEEETDNEEAATDNEEAAADNEEDNSPPSEELVSQIMDAMWRYSDSYSVTNVVSYYICYGPIYNRWPVSKPAGNLSA